MTVTEVIHRTQLSRGLCRLRRVKPISVDVLEELAKDNRIKSEVLLSSPKSDVTPGKFLRLWVRSPWEDYTCVQSRDPSFAFRNRAYFQKTKIRAFPNSSGIQLLQLFSSFRHPNIANVYDVYCYDDSIFVALEYLELSLNELDFHSFLFAE
jgi:serine/threonine protein kinase